MSQHLCPSEEDVYYDYARRIHGLVGERERSNCVVDIEMNSYKHFPRSKRKWSIKHAVETCTWSEAPTLYEM